MLIYLPRWMTVLNCLFNNSIDSVRKNTHQVSLETKTTYSQVCNIESDLVSQGIIIKEKVGRNNIIKLTPKGHKVALQVNLLIQHLKLGDLIE